MSNVNDVVKVLAGASEADLKIASKAIRRALRRHIPLDQAMKLEQFQPGTKVVVAIGDGSTHTGTVKRAGSVRIRVFDDKEKRDIRVAPEDVTIAPQRQRQTRQPRKSKASAAQ